MGLKIGGLSLSKLTEINRIAEMAIKSQMPMSNLFVCTKLAENLLYGVLRKNSIARQIPLAEIKLPAPLDKKEITKIIR